MVADLPAEDTAVLTGGRHGGSSGGWSAPSS